MAAPPSFRGLNLEDYSEFKDDIPLLRKLFPTLTGILTGLSTALSRGLTINDNFAGQLKTTTVTGGAETSILWERPQRAVAAWPAGCWLVSSGAPVAVTSYAWRNATIDGKPHIVFSALGGLTSNIPYTVCFVGLSG